MNSISNKIEKVNNVIVGLGSNLIGNLILFLTTMYITNNVTPDTYGQFRLAFAFISILVITLMLGRDSSILFYYQKEKSDRVIIEESLSGTVLVIAGCIILYLFDDLVIRTVLSNQVGLKNYHLALLMLPLWAVYNLLTPVVRVKGLINSSFILSNLLQRILRFPFLFLFIYAGYNDFGGLAWSMIISQGLLLILLFVYLFRTLEWHTPQFSSFFTRFNYSFSLGMNAIMLSIAGKIDVLLLGHLSTTSHVAIYDIVTSLAIVALFPYIALTKSFEPKLYGYFDHPEKHTSYRNNLSLSFTLTALAGLFFVLFGQELLVLFGSEYSEGSSAFILLSVVYTGISCWGAVSEWMTMNGYARYNFIFLMICGALNVGLCFMLIPTYGLLGATIALGISLFSSKLFAFLFIILKKPAYKLVASFSQIGLLLTVMLIANIFTQSNLIIKIVVYLLTSLLLCMSQKPLRSYALSILKRGKK